MLSVLCSGTLVSDPVSRTSAARKIYCTASLRTPVDGDEAMLASVIAFSDSAVAALLALSKGDSCSIAGRAKLSSWTKDGEERHGLSVVADKVLTAYQAGRARKAAREPEEVPA